MLSDFMRLFMRVHFLGFYFSIDFHCHMRSPDPAFHCLFRRVRDAGNANTIQFIEEFITVRQKLQQGCRQHIACRTHAAVQI